MRKKIWKISNLKYLAAFLIPLIFVMLVNHQLDNDSWYILAEGRYIAENGIYYEDVLSMHGGLNVVVQNYGFAAIFYWIFTTFGATGIYLAMIILNFLICYLLYKICMLLSNKNTNLSLLIMIITNLILALSFVVTRAQMVSFVIFLSLIYILELYIKKKKIKYLYFIPLLSLLQINLHASLWLILFLVMFVYIIDSITQPKHKHDYKTWPLILTSIISFLVGLINPYGIRMITFIITSYSNPVLKELVAELQSFSPFLSVREAILYIWIVLVISLCLFAKNKKIKIRHLLMFFGFLALGLNTIKGLSQFILIMFLPLAYLYENFQIESILDSKLARNSIVLWGGILATCLFGLLLPTTIMLIQPEPDDALVTAVDFIDKDIESKEKSIYTIYTGYNTGGYLEYRGYKPYIDPRGEYFIEKVNGKEDILKEYSDFIKGKTEPSEMLNKYHFDYLLVSSENDPFYKLDDKHYQELYYNENTKTKVYKKI